MSRRAFSVAMAIVLVALMAIGCGGKGSKTNDLEYRDLGIKLTAYDSDTGRPLFKGAESYFSAVQHSSANGVEIEIVAREGIDASNMWVDVSYNAEYLNPIEITQGEDLGDEAIFLKVKHIKGEIPLVASIYGDYRFDGGSFAKIQFASEPFELKDKGLFEVNPEPPASLTYANEEDGIRITWETVNLADYNGDGTVNGLDVFMIASNWRKHPSIDGGRTGCVDGNLDDTVDGSDLFLIAVHFQHAVQGYQVSRSLNELGPYTPIASAFLVNDGNPYYTENDPCVHLNGAWNYLDDNNGQGLDDGFYWYRMEVVDFSMNTLVVGSPQSVLRGPVVYPLAPENVVAYDGWYESIIEWTIPDDDTIIGFNVYRYYTIPDGEDPPGLTEVPYDFGKPINDELIELNEDPEDLEYYYIDRDPPGATGEDVNLFRTGEYYYVVKSYNTYSVESENDETSQTPDPAYPYNATLITDTGNDRVIVAALNSHPNHEPQEQILWDSSTANLLQFDGENWNALDPPGLSNPTMARFFPNVTGDDNELSHLVICDNGNDRVLWINWTSMPSSYCWAVVGMTTPFGVDIDDTRSATQADPNYYMTTGNLFPDDYPDDLGDLIRWNQDPDAEQAFDIFRWPNNMYTVEFVEEISHPDSHDTDGDEVDDPDYTGPALVMAMSQPGMEGLTYIINALELGADGWVTDPYNFLQYDQTQETQYIAASGSGSVGMLSYYPAVGGENAEFIGMIFDKTQAEVDDGWYWWWVDEETVLQINSGTSNPRGTSFVGTNPNAVNLCWADGLIWTVILDQMVYIYQADSVGLGLNNPTYYEWMIKPDWIP